MAKATTHPTCTPTNLNIRTRSSTLYANAPILLASILLNFRRRPESHLQLQVSEKSGVRSQESGVRSQESGARSQEPGARSQEPGARSQEPGVAGYASKVFIRKSGTGICPG